MNRDLRIEHLEQISDPRIKRIKRHKLIDVLVIAVCATVCGAEAWTEMEEFGEAKEEWFRQFLARRYPLDLLRKSFVAQFVVVEAGN